MNLEGYEMVLIGIGEEFEESHDALSAYNKLAEDLAGKNYFIVSLCMDDVIYNSNLNHDRIVTPLGGKRKKQCPDACENALYEVTEENCPICGKKLIYNNILAENYIEQGYLPMWEKHKLWLTGTLNKSLYICELGVSMKLPQVIRWPFERIAMLNNKAFFLRVNEKLPQIAAELKEKGMSVKENSVKWLIEN